MWETAEECFFLSNNSTAIMRFERIILVTINGAPTHSDILPMGKGKIECIICIFSKKLLKVSVKELKLTILIYL